MWNFGVSKKQIGLFILSCMISLQSFAADFLYTVFSVGYSDVEFIQDSNKGLGYKMALGYQIAPQWYVEAGYQQLVRDSLYSPDMPTSRDVINAEHLQQGDALFVSFLGKASDQKGELFYRLGLLKTDIRGQQLLAGASDCKLGKANVFNIDNYGAATMCDYNESGVAAVIGLGFDYFVGARTMIRAEIEYIKGQDSLAVATAAVGLRYNF